MDWVMTIFYVYMGLLSYFAVGLLVCVVLDHFHEQALDAITGCHPFCALLFLAGWPVGVLLMALRGLGDRLTSRPQWL